MKTPATVSRTTLDFWNQLGPWRDADADPTNTHRYLLLTLCDAFGAAHDSTEVYTRDDATHTGWGQLLDVNACPSVALPWLAQFVGARTGPGMTDAQIRALILSRPNTTRGTAAAIRLAAQNAGLTGSQRVDIAERTPNAYSFTVTTYAAETPGGAGGAVALAVKAAMAAVKPGGLVMSYIVQSGISWNQAVGTWATQGATTWAQEGNGVPS